jgi:hypothetical protein
VLEHPLQLDETDGIQSITDGKMNKTMSRDMWCWQDSDTVVMCESTLDCYGDAKLVTYDVAGCTYQKYELGEGEFRQSDYGNTKILAKAEAESIVTAVTE